MDFLCSRLLNCTAGSDKIMMRTILMMISMMITMLTMMTMLMMMIMFNSASLDVLVLR